jgi:hypothetical protein
MNTQCQKNVSLHLSGEEETGSAGEQLVRNSLTDRNGHGGIISPHFHMTILGNHVLENPTTKIAKGKRYSICKPNSGFLVSIKNVKH